VFSRSTVTQRKDRDIVLDPSLAASVGKCDERVDDPRIGNDAQGAAHSPWRFSAQRSVLIARGAWAML